MPTESHVGSSSPHRIETSLVEDRHRGVLCAPSPAESGIGSSFEIRTRRPAGHGPAHDGSGSSEAGTAPPRGRFGRTAAPTTVRPRLCARDRAPAGCTARVSSPASTCPRSAVVPHPPRAYGRRDWQRRRGDRPPAVEETDRTMVIPVALTARRQALIAPCVRERIRLRSVDDGRFLVVSFVSPAHRRLSRDCDGASHARRLRARACRAPTSLRRDAR